MPTIAHDALSDFAARLLCAGEFTEADALATADLLVWADLRGMESHGVLRIPRYIEMVATGIMRPGVTPVLAHRAGAIAVLDGGKAPGAVCMNAAVAQAAEAARAHGIGWCSVRRISHSGAIGYFSSRLAEQGFIGIVMAASKPLMTYFGAKGEALSTNPLSIAAPQDGAAPILLDMSTAAVALGKIMAARDAGAALQPGWAVDDTGAETLDPNKVAAVVPMAGAKGSGLSLMIEVLGSVLVGNPVIAPALTGGPSGGANGVAIALDPAAFGAGDGFARDIGALARAIHALPPAPGVDAVRLPGERGALTAQARLRDGVPLKPGTARRLIEAARARGVAVPAALQDPIR